MTVHIIGAGLAGLACAMELIRAGGKSVVVYEMTHHAGGRCRSFYDPKLERYIDNGTHLILHANTQTLRYINYLNSNDAFKVVVPAVFPFLDLENGEHWTLQPNGGRFPWWLMHSKRRVAGSRLIDYLSLYSLFLARKREENGLTVADCLSGPLMRRLWQPLTVSILNTVPEEASAALLARVIGKSFMRGERACRPYFAYNGLGPALIEPALKRIVAAGGVVRFGSRLRSLSSFGQTLRLHFESVSLEINRGDKVVLALPPWQLKVLWPELPVPMAFRSIVNVHYRLDRKIQLPGKTPFLALIGGLAQWLFIRGDVLSVTVSAADKLVTQAPSSTIVHQVWEDCAKALRIPSVSRPLARVIQEKRATLAHTPSGDKRTVPLPPLPGLVLAGDWTNLHLPTTIEAAITSGVRAALQVQKSTF